MSQSIEFTVVAKDDLYLEGGIRKLFRVAKGSTYPCQMQKNQSFGCLFRHYAKHHGLRKDDLVFHFVDEILQEESPESIYLMPQDEVWVQHRQDFNKQQQLQPSEITKDSFYFQYYKLFHDKSHADVKFIFNHLDKDCLWAHKAILSTRSEYFEAMFRKTNGLMIESKENMIYIDHHSRLSFEKVLEFIYTNHIKNLEDMGDDEYIELMMMADEYILNNLKDLCGIIAARYINEENIGKFICISTTYKVQKLREACIEYIQINHETLRQCKSFCEDIESYPELGLLLLEAFPISKEDGSCKCNRKYFNCPSTSNKRARLEGGNHDDYKSSHEIPTPTITATVIHNANAWFQET